MTDTTYHEGERINVEVKGEVTVYNPVGHPVSYQTSKNGITFRALRHGVYTIQTPTQHLSVTVQSNVDPRHCVISAIIPNQRINAPLVFHVKLFRRPGLAKHMGGDIVTLTEFPDRGHLWMNVVDCDNGTYVCTVIPSQVGSAAFYVSVNGQRCGDLYHLRVSPQTFSIWTCLRRLCRKEG